VAEQAGLKLLVESGRLPHRKVGSHRRIAFDDLISCSRRMPEQQAQQQDPHGFESNANVRLFATLSKLIFDAVPSDPNREEYRQGNTMGTAFRHWRRAKIGRRFRLFFRFDSKARIIIFAWVNDENTLRSSGRKSDP
jgi:toxin YhaV